MQFTLKDYKKICILAPHPDDEILGAGGLLLRTIASGGQGSVVFMTDGSRGIQNMPPLLTRLIRRREFAKVRKLTNRKLKAVFCDFPDGRLAAYRELALARLQVYFARNRSDCILIPNPQEQHPDHQVTAEVFCELVRRQPALFAGSDILFYEVWTPLLKPDLVIDITEVHLQKQQLLACYHSQCKQMHFIEASAGLGSYRALLLPRKIRQKYQQPRAEAFGRLILQITEPAPNAKINIANGY